MKRWICLILTAMMLLGAAGCGKQMPAPTTEPQPSTAPSAAQRESVLRVGVQEGPSACLAGALVQQNDTDRMLWELINDCAPFVPNRDGELVENPSVVESWKTVSLENGALLCTLRLREGLRYSSGAPIRAGDFVLPLLCGAICAREDLGYRMFAGADDYADGSSDALSGIRVLDGRTLQLTVDATYAQSYYVMEGLVLQPWNPEFWLGKGWSVGDLGEGACLISSGTAFRMEPKRLQEQIRTAGSDLEHLVSAGPYRIVSAQPDRVTLEANPNYSGNFEKQQPRIQTLEVRTFTDAAAALERGDIDLISRITDPGQAAALSQLSGFETVTFPRNGYTMLRFNCAAGPTQFTEVRQALASFLDREELSRAIGGEEAKPVHGPYTPGMWQTQKSERFLQELNPYPFDPDAAVQTLVSGGWTLNEKGGEWSGSGLRYKEVTRAQADQSHDCITLSDGRILMPLILHVSVTDSPAAASLKAALELEAIELGGMDVLVTQCSWKELLATFPDSSAALMTEEYPSAVYNHAFRYTCDPDLMALGYNPTGLQDETLDVLSTAMVYSLQPGDLDAYLQLWQQYIQRCNQLLPELPLGIGTSTTVYPAWLTDYHESALWDFSRAVLYAGTDDSAE